MKVDPKWTFILALVTTLFQGVTSGTVHLSGLVPEQYIPIITGWLGLFVFMNNTILTALIGLQSNKPGVFAPATTVPEARAILTEATQAAATTSK